MKIFKPNEISRFKISLEKEEARLILSKTNFEDSPFLDRFNLEKVLSRIFNCHVRVLPDSNNRNLGLRIGYGFNYCTQDAVIDQNVTKNLLEIPLLEEFVARGCEINYIGKSPSMFRAFSDRMNNYSFEWKKLPRPYKPTQAWIEDCVRNYEEYGVELPDVDFVIMNAFPSFYNSNMLFYLISLHYAKKGTPVFLWDIEFRTLRSNENEYMKKVFRFSGADKIFSKDEFKSIANNSYWLLQIPGEALNEVRILNPSIRILPFFPPYWFREDIGMYKPKKKPRYRISYVGNDSERRKSIKKFFTPLSKKNRLHLFGGGMSRRSDGYENFEKYIGTIKMHGAVPQDEVWGIYNNSRVCLSVARSRYYDVGFIVHRWFEVVLGGGILLVSSELYGVEKYMHPAFIVDDCERLENRINLFNKAKYSKILEVNKLQKKFIYRTFSSERDVDTIFHTIGK